MLEDAPKVTPSGPRILLHFVVVPKAKENYAENGKLLGGKLNRNTNIGFITMNCYLQKKKIAK